ncbi:hypothetical protein BKP37_02180 [Anaerobacillus alkalilacustris]|uniref:Uncharacterized protein n=1 Tax=Anaerobacillus alkalilacustris TaxID=393763 RepID=A0A1S2M0X8_9BACI|nr:hypothetical protein [Anaerobacillus alkalilacustris]OIJ17335.1 hypothetical protein BKP37_02180 [Anaerobacillus alkalilacustris]
MKYQHNVYKNWFGREDQDFDVGFNKKYKNGNFTIGGKILIYVVGEFFENKSESQHLLRLPIKNL